MNKHKELQWRSGIGTLLLGAIVMTVAFGIMIGLMWVSSSFDYVTRAQVMSDIIADGATVYARDDLELIPERFVEKADELIARNNALDGSVHYVLTSRRAVPLNEPGRQHFRDYRTIVNVSATGTPMFGNHQVTKVGETKVNALATYPINPWMRPGDLDMLNRVAYTLPKWTVAHQAILRAKLYSGETYETPPNGWRWKGSTLTRRGAKDCSSFIASCFIPYQTVLEPNYVVASFFHDTKGTPLMVYKRHFVGKRNPAYWNARHYVSAKEVQRLLNVRVVGPNLDTSMLKPGDIILMGNPNTVYSKDTSGPYWFTHALMYLGRGITIESTTVKFASGAFRSGVQLNYIRGLNRSYNKFGPSKVVAVIRFPHE